MHHWASVYMHQEVRIGIGELLARFDTGLEEFGGSYCRPHTCFVCQQSWTIGIVPVGFVVATSASTKVLTSFVCDACFGIDSALLKALDRTYGRRYRLAQARPSRERPAQAA